MLAILYVSHMATVFSTHSKKNMVLSNFLLPKTSVAQDQESVVDLSMLTTIIIIGL